MYEVIEKNKKMYEVIEKNKKMYEVTNLNDIEFVETIEAM